MGRITERNNKYKVIIELGRDSSGKRIRHTKEGFKTKKEAKAYLIIKESELLNGMVPNNNKILFKDFVATWYQNFILNGNYSSNTIAGYRFAFDRHILSYLGNMQLCKITVMDIQNFYYELLKKGIKPSSCRKIISCLKKCFNYAIKMQLIYVNPCNIEFVKNMRSNELKIWTESELLHFLDQEKWSNIFLPVAIAAFTGMRIGEIAGLRWPNVDLENLRIKVCEQCLDDKINNKIIHTNILKTSKSYRNITIPAFLKNILIEYKGINEFVITNNKGDMCSPRNISMIFYRRLKKYSLPYISFHDLRHTHATILLLHGENIKVISERLGHESIQITLDTYSHVLPQMEEHTSLLLEELFGSKI